MTNGRSISEQKVQVVRTRTFHVPALIAQDRIPKIIAQLWHENFTGKLQINFTQGYVASVVAEEKLPNQF